MTTLVPVLAAILAAAPPAPFTEGPTVEGVTQYNLPNGLALVLVPDPSAATLTANLTVLVGSRHEGYGEKGMAHLLEHMLFKGSPKYKDPKQIMGEKGARWNGTTNQDRTNYYETLPASDANLDFVLRFEADRLVNAFVDKKDLDTEMTVVRNEFERTENSGSAALYFRVRAAALPWHNYGRTVIGIKADIERVPVDNLKVFYKRYYQPDNAVLVLSGKFDVNKAFALAAQTLGKLPRPTRVLNGTFTSEPIQDGEREVTVRRVGGAPALNVVWRIPALTDPDYPALMVLQGVLGDEPQGRVHQALVEGKKAARARCDLDQLKEPGLFECNVGFKEGDKTAEAREALLKVMETPGKLADADVARSRDGWLAQYEQELSATNSLAFALSNAAGWGDWRLPFLLRDRLKKVTTADVERVWATYFKPQNRTMGEYVPTAKPDRAAIPDAPEAKAVLATYTGGEAVQQGEAFDPTAENIEGRVQRITLPNGALVVLMPKKTRAQQVKGTFRLRLGALESLKGQAAVAELVGPLLERGTKTRSYKAFKNELEKNKSFVSYDSGGQTAMVSLTTQRANLDVVLKLVEESLLTPALDAAELEQARSERLAQLDQYKAEPQVLGGVELARALNPLPADDIRATLPFEEQIKRLKAVKPEDVQAFYKRFYGAQAGIFTLVGDFDPKAVEAALRASYGGWTAKEKFERAVEPYVDSKAGTVTLPTPDKANAFMTAGMNLKMTDASPDYPAMLLASHVLGGSPAARLFVNLREKQGLSYGASAQFSADFQGDLAQLTANAIFNPGNVDKVEAGLLAQVNGLATVSKAELDVLKSELLQLRYQTRTNDGELADELTSLARAGRTMAWEKQLDDAIKALTPEQVNAVVKKYLDPKALVLIKAGDFKSVQPAR
jgi:zinc protease